MATSDTRSVARTLRSTLGRDMFTPATSRLLWVPVHLAVVAAGVVGSLWWQTQGLALTFLLPLSLLIGFSFAGLAFVAHETLHGALTRNRRLRYLVGWVGFLPFCISPRLWIAWHNQVHHGNTNIAGRDPDAYPTLSEYRTSTAARWAVKWGAPRSFKLRGVLTLAIGFTLQSLQILVFARSRKYLSSKNSLAAWGETLLGVGVWGLLLWAIGLKLFFIVVLVPLMVANAIVMAHIITNHSLSPLSDDNDALETSLTVSVPRWFEFYSLGFGYHVEHHLFPAMSNRHAPRVQKELRRVAPQRYQEMPLSQALRLMFTTPRVYANARTLIEPETGETFRTLGPPELSRSTESSARRLVSKRARGSRSSEVVFHQERASGERISSIPPPPHAA